MSKTAADIINEIINREGGYVNNPADKGGPTAYGITTSTAKAHGVADVKQLTKQQAFDIYLADYWITPRFDQVAVLSEELAVELCDAGVNMGPSTSAKFLQRALNVLNGNGKDWPDMVVDGQIGTRTLTALQAFIRKRGDEGRSVLDFTCNALQAGRYIDIAEKDSTQEAFIYGWILNRCVKSL